MLPSTHEPVPLSSFDDALFWRYRYGRAVLPDVAAFMANRAGGAEQYTRSPLQDCAGGYRDIPATGPCIVKYLRIWQCDACGAIAPGACRAARWKEHGYDARERDERDTFGGATDCDA